MCGDISENMVSAVMWIMTIILGIGIILLFLERYRKISISPYISPYMILIGFLGSVIVGVGTTSKKREGFKSIYGF